MDQRLKSKRLNNNVLEMIMRDLMYGQPGYRPVNRCNNDTARMDFSTEDEDESARQSAATVIQFPGTRKTPSSNTG